MISESYSGSFAAAVYDRNSLAEIDAIPLPGVHPLIISACGISNSLFILNQKCPGKYSVLRILRDDTDMYHVQTLISDLPMKDPLMVVVSGGCFLTCRKKIFSSSRAIVYRADGTLKQKVLLPTHIDSLTKILPKENGNLILIASSDLRMRLTEIDMDGTVLRQYHSSLSVHRSACQADIFGTILITNNLNGMEVLDSDLNLLDSSSSQCDQPIVPHQLHYHREGNEVIAVVMDGHVHNGLLTIFRLRDD